MSEEERIFAEHELREREYFAANAREAARRTQEKLRIARIEEARRTFDYSQGIPVRAYTEQEIRSDFPDPADSRVGYIDSRTAQLPEGRYYDDRFANQHEASIYSLTPAQRLWFEMLSMIPRPQNRAESQRFSTETLGSTFSINSLRERRR